MLSHARGSVAIDFVGLLPEDEGKNCIATMTDRCGADMRFVATRTDCSAEDFALVFLDNWYCENGLPDDLVSDHDKLWLSRFWKALHLLTGVNMKLSSAYHPQTNGASERTNKTVIQALRYHVACNQKGWVRALPRIRFNIMNTVNASTGFSPFHLHLGRAPRIIPAIETSDIRTVEDAYGDAGTDAARIISQINTDFLEAQDNMQLVKISQATQANKHRGDKIVYKIGDKVMLSTAHRRRDYLQHGANRVAKFMVRFDGPYRITASHPDTSSYTLALPKHMKEKYPTFHASQLKPYRSNDASLFPAREHARPRPVVGDEGMEEWAVERILGVKHLRRGDKYLIRWQGYGPEDDEVCCVRAITVL
ncbi:transposase-like protein [Phanerochaete sordida]|uniref:Transposase-like protein n=1 Tax=Phanerochaete sordida TaxID=48140 RepID=A0A9P3GQG7_9APHY|nr:transposase-like protein [Phanerochaete sordida]